ncbi:filamin-binding LIM protein 1-like [Anguilla anguilla]|uniref:filamin-binding LIM protein 1-like n=1 Tax=Anguilla anguilla TaxID=7936 RepID=UPI0015B1202A|nr:filamin-binding LIM protein 1-like [Anguilla anguilla]
MASAAPQKRMVSSVFITLSSPHRATVTPSAHATNTHTATRVSPEDSGPSAVPHGARSDARHAHAAPPRDAAVPPRPTQALLSPGTRAAPPPPSASGLRSPPSWTEQAAAAATGNRKSEDYLPPPPPPPPPPSPPPPSAQNAELCSELTSPLPPPPVLEPSADPSLSVSQGRSLQPAPQMSKAVELEERAPPGGGNQDRLLQQVQPSQGEEIGPGSRDVCGFCRKPVALAEPAIEALNRTYHANCFQCRQCQTALAGQMYYNKAGIPLCEDCYLASLEQCWACGEVIKDHVIRALGRAYHPPCFICTTCSRPIGEEKFSQGEVGEVYCLPDYYRKYAPQCNVCQQLIVPGEDGRDSFTVECLGRSFHEDCYRCEVCSILLSTEPNEQGCYPLDGQILCKPCHLTLVQEGHR